MAYTPEQYAAAGQWIAANLDNPDLIASTASSLGLSANDLLTAVQTVNPNLGISDVTSYFQQAGTDYQPQVYTPEPEPVYDFRPVYDPDPVFTPTADVSLTPSGGGALASAAPVTAYDYATAPGGIGLDAMNENIRNFFAGNPTEAETAAAMQQWLVSDADIQRATGRSFADYYPTKGALPTLAPLADERQQDAIDAATIKAPSPFNPDTLGSLAYRSAIGQGGIGLEAMNQNILNYFATNPTELAAFNEAKKWGVSQEDIERATGKSYDQIFPEAFKPGNVLTSGFGNVTKQLGGEGYYKGVPVPKFYDNSGEWGIDSADDQLARWKANIDKQDLSARAPFGFVETPIYATNTGDYDPYVSGYESTPATAFDYLTQNNPAIANAVLGHTSTAANAYKIVNGELKEVGHDEITPEDLAQGNAFFMLAGKTGGPNRERMAQLYRAEGDNLIPVGDPKMYKGAKKQDMGLAFLDMAASALSFVPGPWQVPAAIYKAGRAIDEGDWAQAALAAIPVIGDFANAAAVASEAAQVAGAVESASFANDIVNAVSSAVPSLDSVGKVTNSLQQSVSALKAIDDKNWLGLVASGTGLAGATGAIDANTAGLIRSTANLANVLNNNGSPAQIIAAATSLANNQGFVDRATADQVNAVASIIAAKDDPAALMGAVARAARSGVFNETAKIGAQYEQLNSRGVVDEYNVTGGAGTHTVTDVGAAAFAAAKAAGATDDEALGVANAVTIGTVKSPEIAPRDTNYDPDLVDATAGQALATKIANAQEAVRMGAGEAIGTGEIKAGAGEFAGAGASQAASEKISNAPNFGAAYAAAREAFGPNSTFNYQGKLYSTATFQEDPKLGLTPVEGSGRGVASGKTAEQETALLNTANALAAAQSAKPVESTGFFQNLSNALSNQMKLSSDAANAYLQNNPNSPITASVSTALEAAGELQKNVIGGTALLLDNKPVADAFIKGGNELIKLGQSIGTGPQDTKNWNDTLQLVDQAQGLEKLGVIAGRIIDGTSGLGRQTEVELRQELPALFLGGGTARGVLVASGLIDTKDTAGAAAIDAYDDAVKAGKNHNDALADARTAGFAAGATEAAVQLTIGKLGDLALGNLDNVVSKGVGRVGAEGITEGGQEGGSSLAVDVALGRDVDVNKALTQTVVGAAVGKSTTATTSPVSGVQDATELREAAVDSQGVSNAVNNLQSLYGSDKASTIVQSLTSATDLNAAGQSIAKDLSGIMGDDAAVKTANTLVSNFAVNNAADTMATQGLNVNNLSTVVGNTDSGGMITLGDALGAAITGNGVGVDTSTVVGTKADGSNLTLGELSGIVKGGGTSVTTATGPAVTAGTDTATKVGVSTATDTTTQAETATDTKSGVTTDTTTDANTNTTTQTTTDTNTNTTTQTTTNATTNVTTQVTTNNNTGATTTVTTDPTLGTTSQTTTTTNGTSTTTVDTTSNVTTNVTTDTTTGINTQIVLNSDSGEVVITKVDPVNNEVIETITKTEEELTPEEIEKLTVSEPEPVTKTTTKTPATKKAATPTPSGGGMLLGQGPQATSKIEMPEEAWLGGRFRTDLPSIVAMFPFLFSSQEQQDTAAVSALRRASGVEPQVPKKEAMDYYAYGKEPSIDSVLEPYLNGGSVQKYAQGGIIMPSALQAAAGGTPHKGSHYVQGAGGGQDDLIPARLADGEYVFDAEIVAALGDGSNKEGARRLDAMREAIRKHKRSGSLKKIPPPAKNPLAYFKEANK